MSTVLTLSFDEPEISEKEIFRYMGCKATTDETEALLERTLNICHGKFSYNACYVELPLSFSDEQIRIGSIIVSSRDLKRALDGCTSAIVFAATVGLETDRLMLRYSHISPSLAVCIQAFGAERIESLCNALCDHLKEKYASEGKVLRSRFSPGYGDLALETQIDIFNVLDCKKKIGLTLNDSLLMSPTKSVTAIVGIKNMG